MLIKRTKEEFLKLRRARIALEYSNLNEMQREAVMTTDGPLLILAGAGSGKTTVLINRIANLIRFGSGADSDEVPDYITDEDCDLLEKYIKAPSLDIEARVNQISALRPVAPYSIIAITFTNKAAGELKERLARAIGESANDVWAATFHSACVRILRRDIDKLGFDKTFTIYDVDDSVRVMKEVIRAEGLDEKMFAPKVVLGIIGRDAKDKLISPKEYEKAQFSDYYRSKVAVLYKKYQERLREANALDFDDIIMHTVTLLRDFPEVREFYQRKFRHVLIDEYQDTNHAQYMLASYLAGGYRNICVVGDDDQSIYRFRGATIGNILEFENQYDNARVIRLEQNYRSTKRILDIANAAIAHNVRRKSKTLYTTNEDGALPTVCNTQNETTEANFIVSNMLAGRAKGEKWSDFAVLYRTNAQSNRIEQILATNAVPYRVIGGHKFFDRAEVRDMLAYLWVIHNPSDTVRLKRIINTPTRKIGDKLIETLDAVAQEYNITMYEALKNAEQFPQLSRSLSAISNFVSIIETLRAKVGEMSLSDFYDAVVVETGYADALIAKGDDQSKTRLENVNELKSTIMEYEKNAEEPTLNGFLDEVALYTDIEQYNEEEEKVTLMTIHSAKGLEFNTVFLAGVEEGLFPGERSIGNDDEIEEERRLFYVAVTRAKQMLYITHAHERTIYGQTRYGRPSRFINEVPKEKYNLKSEVVSYTQNIQPRVHARPAAFPSYAPKKLAPAAAQVSLKAGERVNHKAFGDGIVVSVQPMGGDALLEIKFDTAGTKRLMQKTAGQFIKKI